MVRRVTEPYGFLNEEVLNAAQQKMVHLLRALRQNSGGAGDEEAIALEARGRLETALQISVMKTWHDWPAEPKCQAALQYLAGGRQDGLFPWACLFGWTFTHSLGRIVGEPDAPQRSRSWLDEWLLSRIIAQTLRDLGVDEALVGKGVSLIGLLITNQHWFDSEGPKELLACRTLEALLKDGDAQQYLGINRYEEIVWFNGEAFDELLWWLYLIAVVQICIDSQMPVNQVTAALVVAHRVVEELQQAAAKSEFQVENLLELVKG